MSCSTAALVQVNSKDVTIAGAGLSSTYVLEQFHIHWSSEHLVDSVAHPLEVGLFITRHLVSSCYMLAFSRNAPSVLLRLR